MPTLRLGDTGNDVQTLQRQLIRDDGSQLDGYGADGMFGEETEEAVIDFQSKHSDLVVDGIAGPNTNARLISVNDYRIGESGRGVEMLQRALMQFTISLPEYGADGEFGAESQNAIETFQTHNSIQVDGIAGPVTFDTLDKALNISQVQNGDSGTIFASVVRAVQQGLVENDIDVSIDGIFGDGTEDGVREFQSNNNIQVDGIAGEATLLLIYLQSSLSLMTDSETKDWNQQLDEADEMAQYISGLDESPVEADFTFDSDAARADGVSEDLINKYQEIIDEGNSLIANASINVQQSCTGSEYFDEDNNQVYLNSCTWTDIQSWLDGAGRIAQGSGLTAMLSRVLARLIPAYVSIPVFALASLGRWYLDHVGRHDCGVVISLFENLPTPTNPVRYYPYAVSSQC
ncbi:peptidoglycan hydrolase-like protein with peptidoglycan-binding domain [Geomicrobium halophilum]|uniref:Peptidoglycan hydrolase-like protein with peptidoglycan-binding domain n=1 Tax=Geomicrobium halophilum TaxID=549000 RepID=A0A841PML3_9BACL|nr:peptidoglycan-binding protein [Geomicrobium halophilum]MBB6449979.1 peptidoglycan hydrolase-like protein with peptidoglycan-binding domain [Geomicrobium halophilum]